MTVVKDLTRTAFEITWDAAAVGAEDALVDIKATNPDNGDVSTRDGLTNDGRAVWSTPADYSGTVDFEVVGPDGTETGTITV